MASGVRRADEMLANVCKHHVTKLPYEIGRLAQDLAGGLVATMPAAADLEHPEIGFKKEPARALAGITDGEPPAIPADPVDYMGRVFQPLEDACPRSQE